MELNDSIPLFFGKSFHLDMGRGLANLFEPQAFIQASGAIDLEYIQSHRFSRFSGFGQKAFNQGGSDAGGSKFRQERNIDQVNLAGISRDEEATHGAAIEKYDAVLSVWELSLVMFLLGAKLHSEEGFLLDCGPICQGHFLGASTGENSVKKRFLVSTNGSKSDLLPGQIVPPAQAFTEIQSKDGPTILNKFRRLGLKILPA